MWDPENERVYTGKLAHNRDLVQFKPKLQGKDAEAKKNPPPIRDIKLGENQSPQIPVSSPPSDNSAIF